MRSRRTLVSAPDRNHLKRWAPLAVGIASLCAADSGGLLQVGVNVSPVARLEAVAPAPLLITSADLARGFVDMPHPLRLRVYSGKVDADTVIGDDPQLRRKIPELGRMHFTVAASDFDDAVPNGRWKAVSDCAIVTMSRDDDPSIEAL